MTPVIIDTDAGPDDMMALAFLLSSPGVTIEAVTVGTGLAHIDAGARNVLRLLDHAGRPDVPVYGGRTTPLAGDRAFSDAWRTMSDTLPGVHLPGTSRTREVQPAAEFLARRLTDTTRPVRVLALGGLTNIAEALSASAYRLRAVTELVIMGGAVHVPGNLHEADDQNTTAEWNFYVDAEAARQVFEARLPITLVPLDATNRVPMDTTYRADLQDDQAPMARFVYEVLGTVLPFLENGRYFAWDPLAAAVLIDPSLLTVEKECIEIRTRPPEEGRSVAIAGRESNARVAVDADAARFRRLFLDLLRTGSLTSHT